uniref:Integrase_H2C2 domain-containing protein n=1 Tax=Glossina austeni TaxID=7395 RepID=A0A1A9USK2_GLOAU
MDGTKEEIKKIEEKQDIPKTRIHEVYQQIDGQINALEGKVDDALSIARLNVLEEKVTKVISQSDANLETLEEKVGGTFSQFAALRKTCREDCNDSRKDRKRCMPEEQNTKNKSVVRRIKVETNDGVRNPQLADDNLKVIINAKKGERVKGEGLVDRSLWKVWYSKNGPRTRNLLVIARAKCKEIIEKHHRGRNEEHFGVMKTVKEIKRRLYWVGCLKSVVA